MSLDNNTIVILLGLGANFLAIVGYFTKIERRLTTLETIVQILRRGIILQGGETLKHRATDETD